MASLGLRRNCSDAGSGSATPPQKRNCAALHEGKKEDGGDDALEGENFAIAYEFCAYNSDHHRFLDVDPAEVDALYEALSRRLDRNAKLEERDLLEKAKARVLSAFAQRPGPRPPLAVRDPAHRVLAMLYWLAGQPGSAPGGATPATTPAASAHAFASAPRSCRTATPVPFTMRLAPTAAAAPAPRARTAGTAPLGTL